MILFVVITCDSVLEFFVEMPLSHLLFLVSVHPASVIYLRMGCFSLNVVPKKFSWFISAGHHTSCRQVLLPPPERSRIVDFSFPSDGDKWICCALVDMQAGAAEAQRFCKAFQEIHRKLVCLIIWESYTFHV